VRDPAVGAASVRAAASAGPSRAIRQTSSRGPAARGVTRRSSAPDVTARERLSQDHTVHVSLPFVADVVHQLGHEQDPEAADGYLFVAPGSSTGSRYSDSSRDTRRKRLWVLLTVLVGDVLAVALVVTAVGHAAVVVGCFLVINLIGTAALTRPSWLYGGGSRA
jgi:hypothetical protein